MVASTQHIIKPTPRGAVAGALGSLIYLPVMLLLQPTPFARIVFAVWPGLPQAAGEFIGWLLHVALLVGMAITLAYLVRWVHDVRLLLVAAVGWSFLAAWLVLFGVVIMGLSLSLFGWALETTAHVINGLVVGGTLAYMQQLMSATRDV